MRPRAALAALVVSLAPPAVAAAQGRDRDGGAASEELPCADCILHMPPSTADRPRPLLVALHGDGGAMLPLVRAWQAAADEADAILLAPRCPRELGCAAQSFWKWLGGRGHDEGWLGGLIDAVAARHAIDPARVYATGYSGGATYLGWYVPRHPERFAAVAHIAGGAPWGVPCPACKVPVLFVIGATDPMIVPYTAPLRRYYDACGGHEVTWQALPGVTHESILGHLQAGRAPSIMRWLMERPSSCLALADGGAHDADAPTAAIPDASTSVAGEVDAGPHEPHPDAMRVPPRSACICGLGATGGPRGALPLFVSALLVLVRRRTSSVRAVARVG